MTKHWAKLTSPQIEARQDGLLVLPIGATEQHGPHLPVHLDAAVADHLAGTAAATGAVAGRCTVAPVLSFGASAHHLPRAGTLSLSSTTLALCLEDLLDSAVTAGWRRLLVVNGHGGNRDIARQAVRDCATTHPVVGAAVSYWDLAAEQIREAADSYGVELVPGHAGAFETSLALAIDTVRRDVAQPPREHARRAVEPRAHPDVLVEQHGWIHRVDGYTDDPTLADAALGAEALDVLVGELAHVMQTLLEAQL